MNKLSFYGIHRLQLTWFSNYLTNRQQYVTFSQRSMIKCGVPQGSILGPILFLLYINDILNSSTLSKFILFADDTNIIYSDKTLTTLLQKVNLELNNVLNNGSEIEQVKDQQFLGVILNSKLDWKNHINYL